ncbi:MAG: Na(+)/H(+) antiporter subunit B [Halioglobus sp.]|nr:Na(+)/H(+) antiporter subunit B [Halioglobus sp.]
MRENGILRIVTRFLIPLIMLFALYVQFHGDYSPGGGFQAGVLFAAAWILFVLIYGLESGLAVIPERAMFVLSAAGALLYGFIGLLGVLLGGRFLDFYPLLENPQAAQQAGIILVEFGVGVTVACVVMLIFTMFARRRGELGRAWHHEEED